MKIIFAFDDTGERLVYDCGWSTAKKLLDLIWEELTIKSFDKKVEEQNRKLCRDILGSQRVKKEKGMVRKR